MTLKKRLVLQKKDKEEKIKKKTKKLEKKAKELDEQKAAIKVEKVRMEKEKQNSPCCTDFEYDSCDVKTNLQTSHKYLTQLRQRK